MLWAVEKTFELLSMSDRFSDDTYTVYRWARLKRWKRTAARRRVRLSGHDDGVCRCKTCEQHEVWRVAQLSLSASANIDLESLRNGKTVYYQPRVRREDF